MALLESKQGFDGRKGRHPDLILDGRPRELVLFIDRRQVHLLPMLVDLLIDGLLVEELLVHAMAPFMVSSIGTRAPYTYRQARHTFSEKHIKPRSFPMPGGDQYAKRPTT